MADRQGQEAVRDFPPTEGDERPAKNKPVVEFRIGRVKAAVFANETQAGTKHRTVLRKLFKRNESSQWESTDSFDRDELPLVAEVSKRAYLWIFEQAHG
jgi:hypothetical protein